MNLDSRIWKLGNVFTGLLLLLTLRLVYWQMLRGSDLQLVTTNPLRAVQEYVDPQSGGEDQPEEMLVSGQTLQNMQKLPQPLVQRAIDLLNTITRGSIYDRNNRLLAYDQAVEDGAPQRFYAEPSLAHAVGYVSGLRTGISGLELFYNEALLGLDRADAQFAQLLHQPIRGSDLILTIDSHVQRAAETALEGKTGAVVVLDGQSGAILALASAPRFDPNRMNDQEYISGLISACETNPQCQSAFLNRATQALYPPGSTWKTIILIAGLDSGQITPKTIFDFGKAIQGPDGPYYVYRVDGHDIPDPNHKEAKLDLTMSYARSANAAFARIGDEMPPEILIDYARRFGFSPAGGDIFPLEIEFSPAQLAEDTGSLYEDNVLRAVTAIGQGELLTSPLNMAMIVLAVLNDGDLPLPYLVQSILPPSGEAAPASHATLNDLMRPETARTVHDMMVAVVKDGSGRKAAVEGVTVGGKTGTAQIGGSAAPHAWFMGFAEKGERSVVVVVLVENGGEGSQTAAPIFAQLAGVALNELGETVEEVVPNLPTPVPTGQPSQEPQPTPAAGAEPEPTATPVPGQMTADLPYKGGKDPFGESENLGCPAVKDALPGSGKFIWPSAFQLLSGTEFREGHPGIDLGAPSGTPVYAADTGVVIFAGWSGSGYGNVIVIDHGNGYKTLYAHLSQISTHCGAKVQQGKIIGMSGDTGNSSGPHLHFEVRVADGYLDPLRVLPVPTP